MKKVGTIKEIWRYPVKGMAGEKINSCFMDAFGLRGDHLFAVRDTDRKEIQSCKFRPNLLQCIASYTNANDALSDKSFTIRFPDGTALASDSEEMNDKISALLGHASTLESLRPANETEFYKRYKKDDYTWLDELKATFVREPGEPLPDFTDLPQDFIDYVTQLGTFFLVSPFHIITTASIAHLKNLQPNADWDIRRFRPNIVIEPVDGELGLQEQDWIGKQLKVGGISIDCSSPAPRCGAVTRQQQGLDADKSMLRTIIKEADQNLGIYGDISHGGNIQVGDDVYLA
ncbi:MOSC domain-containing protein [Hydrogenovibrio kuenenii]|uniref:MOSC domain-containing protein n=1 Tax=Hydrogenovibrio kuenenii TaxID=63658 RepID=UPI000465C098|nr:MOSC domain-containing protein [Hydrogenovibrio kuenenii]